MLLYTLSALAYTRGEIFRTVLRERVRLVAGAIAATIRASFTPLICAVACDALKGSTA